jgi:phosphatidylglycerophosphatase A
VLARRYSLESEFGKFVDPLTDKILILVPLTAFAVLKVYSPWWVVPVFVREVIVTFCRVGWVLEGKVLGAEKLGKFKLGFQVAAVIAAFLFMLVSHFSVPSWVKLTFETFMMVLLLTAIGLTVISGVSFLLNNRKLFKSRKFARFTSAVWVGLIPYAPGTWGSLVGVAIVLMTAWSVPLYSVTFFLLVWVGYWAVSRLDLSKQKDPGFVVIDEVLGMMVALFGILISWQSVLIGFLLFRLFDILKPFPLRRFEKMPGYWGILLDDLGAGLYAWFFLRLFFKP